VIASLTQKFKRLPAKERSQIVILVVCVIVTSYTLYAAMLWQDMFKAENLANRKANRIETRIGKLEEPKFSNEISDKNLAALEAQLAKSDELLAQATQQFIPLENATQLQQLKLTISELAERSGLTIKQFEVLGIKYKANNIKKDTGSNTGSNTGKNKGKGKGKGKNTLTKAIDSRNKYYQRPFFSIQAESRFFSLLDFIEALKKLNNIAIVRQIDIVRGEQGKLLITMKVLV